MYAFQKSVRKADHIRRYSIQTTASGWEVREEQDSQLVRHTYYQDWHRVERVRLSMTLALEALREKGWQEV